MGGGQLPLEPFVANKHLILNPTTMPRAADQARESLPATSSTPSEKSRWTNIRRGFNNRACCTAPAVLFNRCSSHRRPRQSTDFGPRESIDTVPMQEQDSWSRDDQPKLRASWQHVAVVRRQDHGGEDGTTGVGFRPAVSAVHWMWGLIVPHPGSGNPSGPSLFPVPQTCRPRLCLWAVVFFSQPTEPANHKRTTDSVRRLVVERLTMEL